VFNLFNYLLLITTTTKRATPSSLQYRHPLEKTHYLVVAVLIYPNVPLTFHYYFIYIQKFTKYR